MKLFLICVVLMIFSTLVFAEETPQVARIEISPADTTVTVGEEVQFEAEAYDSENNVVETTFTWSVEGDIGEIKEEGEFTATTAGTGTVTAAVNSVSTSVDVNVIAEEEPGNGEVPGGEPVIASIEIFPSEATVIIGGTVQFEVAAKDSAGEEIEIQNAEWSLDNLNVGSIDGTGKFTASAEGETQVTALVGNISGSASVTVVKEIPQGPGINTISIQRQHPDGKVNQFGSMITENSSITLGGIPYPFNFINGGDLFFPDGSLSDNIVITIKLPSFAKMDSSNRTVDFGGDIVSA